MFELLIIASFKSHVLVALAALLGGGALGFLYGSKVEAKAVSAAKGAVSNISKEVKKL